MKHVRRIVVMVVAGTVLAVTIAVIVLADPAFIVIPLGLAILAVEFAWARRWLRSARAILPLNSKNHPATANTITLQSLRRSAAFLLRKLRRIVLPKRKLT